MKTIIVPTDFSQNSINALAFAKELALESKAKIILSHAYSVIYGNLDAPYYIIAEEMEDAKKDSDSQLKELAEKVFKASQPEFDIVSIENSAVDGVLQLIKERNADLVVMGTEGAHGLEGFIFGSNATKVIENAQCPVIAIPEGALFENLRHITFATDYHAGDLTALKNLVEIVRPFNFQILVLHISALDNVNALDVERMQEFREQVKHMISYPNLTCEVMYGQKNVEAALEKHVSETRCGLLVMTTHDRHNIYEKLFSRSKTKQLANHLKVPLMAYHPLNTEEMKIIR